jgi:prepilin-type N-terminal cleavage/methylation domain-containing protein
VAYGLTSAEARRVAGGAYIVAVTMCAVKRQSSVPRESMKPNLLRPHRIARTVPEGPPAAAFSLLEMMTVLALLLIFASFALPTYQNIALRTREAALRGDLYTLRSMIDRFTLLW